MYFWKSVGLKRFNYLRFGWEVCKIFDVWKAKRNK